MNLSVRAHVAKKQTNEEMCQMGYAQIILRMGPSRHALNSQTKSGSSTDKRFDKAFLRPPSPTKPTSKQH